MEEKRKRNKFRDLLGDYYLTNRQIGKETQKEKGPWKKNEKIMLAVAIVLVIAVIIKYAFFK
ncbi:MAG: hypothetical protein RR131_02775 [Anaerovorax sp.]